MLLLAGFLNGENFAARMFYGRAVCLHGCPAGNGGNGKQKQRNSAEIRWAFRRCDGTPGETRTHYIPLRSMACRFVHRPLHNLPYCLI